MIVILGGDGTQRSWSRIMVLSGFGIEGKKIRLIIHLSSIFNFLPFTYPTKAEQHRHSPRRVHNYLLVAVVTGEEPELFPKRVLKDADRSSGSGVLFVLPL